MLQCAVSDADIVTGVVCHASAFLISAGNTATPAYPVANRTLDAVWICTTHKPYTAHVGWESNPLWHPPMFLSICHCPVRPLLTYLHTHQQRFKIVSKRAKNYQMRIRFRFEPQTPTVGFEPTSTFAQPVFKTGAFTTRSRWLTAVYRNRTYSPFRMATG